MYGYNGKSVGYYPGILLLRQVVGFGMVTYVMCRLAVASGLSSHFVHYVYMYVIE